MEYTTSCAMGFRYVGVFALGLIMLLGTPILMDSLKDYLSQFKFNSNLVLKPAYATSFACIIAICFSLFPKTVEKNGETLYDNKVVINCADKEKLKLYKEANETKTAGIISFSCPLS